MGRFSSLCGICSALCPASGIYGPNWSCVWAVEGIGNVCKLNFPIRNTSFVHMERSFSRGHPESNFRFGLP